MTNGLEEARKKYEDALAKIPPHPERISKRRMRAWRKTPEYVAFKKARAELNKYNIIEKVLRIMNRKMKS